MAAPSDVYSVVDPAHIITPSVLSRPPTPSRSSSNSSGHAPPLPSSSSAAAAGFDPNDLFSTDPGAGAGYPPVPPLPPHSFAADLDLGSLPLPPAPFATGSTMATGMTRTGSNNSSGSAGSGSGGRGMLTRAKTGTIGGGGVGAGAAGGGFVSFDPERGSDLEDDDDDDDDAARQVEGRPRKRKSTRDLRSAAQSQAAPASAAGGGKADGGDGGDGEDKARRKIQIEYIEEKSKRHITFSKRKAGIMKKAYELSTLTGTQVLLLVVSESGWVYTFTTDKFKPLVKEDENGQLSAGQKLIAACLEAKDGSPNLSAAYTPAASSTGNFEANSSIHGGQISLKTGARNRPTATNRRVSSRGRNHIPTAIQTGAPPMPLDPSLPMPPGSGGIPPLPQLPTPLSSNYLDPTLPSPRGPMSGGGPRSVSHPPISPARPGYSLQQQQQHAHQQQQHQDYQEMMQRADMLHLQNQGYDHQSYDMYNLPTTSSMGHHHHGYHSDPHGLPPLPQPPAHLQQQHHSQHLPPQQQQQHLSIDPSLPQPPPMHHSRSYSHTPGSGGPHTPHRTLHHQASHGHLSAAHDSPYGASSSEYAHGGGGGGGAGGNYTHVRDPSMVSQQGAGVQADPRQAGGGWQTPQQHGGHSGANSMQNTPVHGPPGGSQVYVGA
ncbi:hypothetical protein Rhopal_007605-T1 [Rhodotorula paludigena]|uniref:MADS-box domain-containing protein n=1 Tax=Rhodotorula paludigena TaxID=86838 RepID=A0AAV5GZV9_9BASI|nr:hypothetical protein Rhopal_007605-T1 [Rhodotorula paludigena]